MSKTILTKKVKALIDSASKGKHPLKCNKPEVEFSEKILTRRTLHEKETIHGRTDRQHFKRT